MSLMKPVSAPVLSTNPTTPPSKNKPKKISANLSTISHVSNTTTPNTTTTTTTTPNKFPTGATPTSIGDNIVIDFDVPTTNTVIQDHKPKKREKIWTKRLYDIKENYRSKRQSSESHQENLFALNQLKKDDNNNNNKEKYYTDHHQFSLMDTDKCDLGSQSVLWSLLVAILKCFSMRY